jgi:hypothetical protein
MKRNTKEDVIIYPFICMWDVAVMTNVNHGICRSGFDSTGSCKAIWGNVVRKNATSPMDRKVTFVCHDDGGITICLDNVKTGSLCPRRSRCNLDIEENDTCE